MIYTANQLKALVRNMSKGGTLVSAMFGLHNRSAMGIDATLKNLSLTLESAKQVFEEVT